MSPRSKPSLPIDIYVRVSQKGGRAVEEEGGTAAEQERRCRAQLEAHGYTVGKVWKDIDQSGTKTSRPAFDQVKARMADGITGGMIVINLSRFGRNRQVAQDIIDIEASGGTILSIEDNLDTSTPSGRFALEILAAVNTLYVENVTEGWRRVQTRKNAEGVQPGPTPLGYKREGVSEKTGKPTGKFVPDEATAPLVREIFRRRAVEGASVRSLAHYLTENDPEGRTWTPGATRKILANPAYLGTVRHGNLVKEGAHEALVDARTFRLAEVETRATGKSRAGGPLLGGGLCRCGVCGSGMVKSVATNSQGRKYAFLRCGSSANGHVTLSYRKATVPIIAEAIKRVDAYLAANPMQQVARAVPQDLLDDLAQAEADLAELQRALDAGQIKGLAFSLPYQQAEEDRERLLREIEEAGQGELVYTVEDQRFAAAFAELVHGQLGDSLMPGYWETLNEEQTNAARKVLKRFLGSVTIKPGKEDPADRLVFGEGEAS